MSSDLNSDSIIVLSRDEPRHVIAANGSGSWAFNPNRREGSIRWLLLSNKLDGKRRVTLVGRISSFEVDHGGDNPGRIVVKIDEYAETSDLNVCFETRSTNPIQFVQAQRVLGISPEELELKPVPKQTLRQSYERGQIKSATGAYGPLSIAEAKAGLAVKFGIDPDQIDIIIRA